MDSIEQSVLRIVSNPSIIHTTTLWLSLPVKSLLTNCLAYSSKIEESKINEETLKFNAKKLLYL